jgi:hypothetical protein
MKRTAILTATGLAFTAALSSTPASATFVRTFVSGTGSDSNPCTRTQPCLTFAFAITQTTGGGEIDVLDPGDYGPLTINKAISIVNDGVGTVGIRALPGGTAITIQAGVNDRINLRGLTIEGAGVGLRGIEFDSGAILSVVDCFIRNFGGDGIILQPNSDSTVWITNTISSENGVTGINIVVPSSITFGAYLDRTTTNNNTYGVHANNISPTGAYMFVSVTNSVSNNNGSYAYFTAAGSMSLQNVFYAATLNNAAGSNTVHVGSNSNGPGTLLIGRTSGGNVDCESNAPVGTYGNNEITGFFLCNVVPFTLR